MPSTTATASHGQDRPFPATAVGAEGRCPSVPPMRSGSIDATFAVASIGKPAVTGGASAFSTCPASALGTTTARLDEAPLAWLRQNHRWGCLRQVVPGRRSLNWGRFDHVRRMGNCSYGSGAPDFKSAVPTGPEEEGMCGSRVGAGGRAAGRGGISARGAAVGGWDSFAAADRVAVLPGSAGAER